MISDFRQFALQQQRTICLLGLTNLKLKRVNYNANYT